MKHNEDTGERAETDDGRSQKKHQDVAVNLGHRLSFARRGVIKSDCRSRAMQSERHPGNPKGTHPAGKMVKTIDGSPTDPGSLTALVNIGNSSSLWQDRCRKRERFDRRTILSS
jgi:hypothetical protein